MSKKPAATSQPCVVREIGCKTILNRSSICDYTLNCYVGCSHGCVYCYARYMQRFHPHVEPWGQFVDVKVNAVEALWRQLRRCKPGTVFVSSACDGWQHEEANQHLTRRACQLLLQHGFELHILTKSDLVLRDLDVLASSKVLLGVTITCLNDTVAQLWEPNASPPSRRLEVLRVAKEAGLDTAVMFGPLLPVISDTEYELTRLFQAVADSKVDAIWVDALNRRPKVWESLVPFLRHNYPELFTLYRRVLFDAEYRRNYLDQLRKRVAKAASNAGVKSKTSICF